MKKKYYSSRRRIRKAYWTTFRVAWRYWWLSWVSRFRGKAYYQKNITKVHIKNANYVREAILGLEGLFIKVGQLLSILTNLLPKEYHAPLQSLQDQIPPKPYEDIQERVLQELGQPIDAIFDDFDPNALATASIGQAHKAKLKDGTAVVVKVQHLNIERIAKTDLDIVERLTQIANYIYDIQGTEFAYKQVRKLIEEELDFVQEAQSSVKIAKNLQEHPQLIIPAVHLEYSTQRILVTTFCEGVKSSNIEQLKEWNVDLTNLATRLIELYVQMILRDGLYHADPHPGNILVQQDGTIVLIDFGATAVIQPKLRKGIPRLIEAIATFNPRQMVETLQEMEFLSDRPESVMIAERIIEAAREFLENEIQVRGMNLTNLENLNPFDTSIFKLQMELGRKTIANTVQVPKDYIMLNRTAILLLGLCSALDSSLNPVEVTRPSVQQLLKEEQGNLVQQIARSAQQLITDTAQIPSVLLDVLKSTRRGELKVQIQGIQQQNQLQFALAQQLVFTLLLITTTILGFWMHAIQDAEMAKYCFGASFVWLVLFIRSRNRAKTSV